MDGYLNLGTQISGEPAVLPLNALKKHVVVLGASGSGKTVMGKVIIEEAALNRVPSIIIDPQGDLASLGIAGNKEEMQKRGVSPEIAQAFSDIAEIRIFTPASSRGIPLSINPLKLPSAEVPEEEAIRSIDLSAACITKFMGFDIEADEGRAAQRFLYQLLQVFWKRGEMLGDFNYLADFVEDPTKLGLFDSSTIISDRERTRLARKMRQLTIGTNQLIFNFGVPIDIDTLMRPTTPGKTPVNIIYLNVLTADEQKQFFVAMIAQEIYNWMLQNPSEKPQLVFYIDEIAPYMPPYPLNPPAKDAIVMLFKQGRKYGVSCLIASQNFADLDYKALGQAGTWLIGRFMAKQDLEKIKPTLKGVAPNSADAVVRKLPALQPGEFIVISPDNADNVVQLRTRWLFTRHKTLDDESINEAMGSDIQQYFKKFAPPKQVSRQHTRQHYTGAQIQQDRSETDPYLPKSSKKDIQDVLKFQNPSPVSQANRNPIRTEISVPRAAEAPAPVEERKPQENKNAETVYISRLTCPQQEALKIAKGKLSGTLFSKDEEISDVSFRYIPLWRVGCAVRKGIPMISRRTETENVYVNALNGMLCTVEGKSIHFTSLVEKRIAGISDLDGIAEFEEVEKGDVEYMKPRITEAKARSTVHRIFGKEVLDSDLVLLPVWTFSVKSVYTKRGRTIVIDGVMGKEIESGAF